MKWGARTRWLAVVIGWLAMAAAADAATTEVVGIEVYPPQVKLDSARDRQRLVVQARAADGRTFDVTAATEVTAGDGTFAAIDRPDGRIVLRPLADGDTTIRVAHAGHVRELPLRVVSASSDPPLSFRVDVMPVFARGGCNMGSCHGAARGKDGFRLSLFGFDPAGDHQRITRELPGRRIDLAHPEESLLLLKATGAVPHTGGKRFAADDELADRLVRWIAAGAPDDPGPDPAASVPQLVGLDLYPPSALIEGEAATQPLAAVARFADGTDRDVTDLAWYGTNNDRTTKVSAAGVVTSGARGEGFIMARYDTITVGVPMVVIPQNLAFHFPEEADLPGATEGAKAIDALVNAKLAGLRIAPSPVCDDETFLRRVSLDLVGLLPTPDERARFLADAAPDKRRRVIDELMTRKELVDLWVMKWAEILQIRSANDVSPKAAILYHQWLDRRIAANEPLDRMVRDLLTATGGTFDNPPTNYFQLERNTLKLAENVAQAFLGMRIQCAQCHNHPFDRWTMDDYYGFASFFAHIGRKAGEDPRETIIFDAGSGDVKHPVGGRVVPPKFLGGAAPDCRGRDRRAVLAEWLASPDNEHFGRNLVNIVWAHFFGAGIVDAVDDVRVSNPPANAPLLDALARSFVASKYDFKRLVREICTSHAYQRSTQANDTNAGDERNFSKARLRRIRAEVLLDMVTGATATQNKFKGLPLGARAVQIADGNTSTYFLSTFGRATRGSACSCEVKMEPNLSQALHLLNGDTVQQKIAAGGVVKHLLAEKRTPEQVIEELYLRTLTRLPTDKERAALLEVVADPAAKDPAAQDPAAVQRNLEDGFWAILNSREFVFNH